MARSEMELESCEEALESATDLIEAGRILAQASVELVAGSSLCFLPFGRDISSMVDATLFHEQHSREHLLQAVLEAFPGQQRELGAGSQSATERIFSLREPIVDLNELFGPDGLERKRCYNEFWRPCHVERQLFAPLVARDAPLGFICIGRSLSEPAFRDLERQRAARLGAMATAMLERLHPAGADAASAVLAALRNIPVSCALFDLSARLLWASSAAVQELKLHLVGIGPTQLVQPTALLCEWQAKVRCATASGARMTQAGDLLLQQVRGPAGSLMLVTRSGSREAAARARLERLAREWRLTARQLEVLMALLGGRTNKEIASSLACSTRTIEVHVSALLRKSGCTSRSELLARVWAGG